MVISNSIYIIASFLHADNINLVMLNRESESIDEVVDRVQKLLDT